MKPQLQDDDVAQYQSVQTRLRRLENQLATVVTALPSPPLDGQEVTLGSVQTVVPVDAKVVYWRIAYDQNSSAWYPIGRQEPIYALRGLVESVSFASANAWGSVNANDPQVTLPLVGDYDVEFGCGVMLAPAVTNTMVGLRVAGVDPPIVLPSSVTGSDAAIVSGPGTNATWDKSGFGSRKITTTAANTTVVQRYMTQATGTFIRGNAWIKAYPRRITS